MAGIVIKAGYHGTKGNFLQRARQVNLNGNRPAPASTLAEEQARAADFRTNYNAMDSPSTRFNSRLDPRFGTVNYYDNSANSNFHAFELQATRPFRGGYSVDVAYTRSKSIDDVSDALVAIPNDSSLIQDPRNTAANRALSAFDLPWRFVVTHVWELPWGKRVANPALRRLVSGWGLSGISQFRPGFPVSFISGPRFGVANSSMVTTGGLVRPNAAGPIAFEPRPAGSAGAPNGVNTEASPISAYAASLGLSQPRLGQFGTLGRSTNRIRGLTDFSWNAYKNLAITERVQLQLRGEFYNLFNHHSFQDVVVTLTNPGFGQYTTPGQSQRTVQLGALVRF